MRVSSVVRLSKRRIDRVLWMALAGHYEKAMPEHDAFTQARVTLGWMYKSPKLQRPLDLVRGVQEYTKTDRPLAYILGSQPFGKLDLLVREPVLIPRPETEQWAMMLAKSMRKLSRRDRTLRILDLCSGSGCIGLLLLSKLAGRQRASLTGLDISRDAIDLSSENAARNSSFLGNAEIAFRQLDLFSDASMASFAETQGPFDLVVSNPPYIPYREYIALDRSVRDYESRLALLGCSPLDDPEYSDQFDGVAFYRRIAHLLPSLAAWENAWPGAPRLVLEVGAGQSEEVAQIFSSGGRYTCEIEKDYAGHGRSVWVYDKE